MSRATVALMLTLLSAPVATTQEIYRWVDEHGRVHYGDRAPDAAPGAEPIRVKPARPAPSPAPEASARRERERRLLDALSAERAERRAALDKAEREAAELQRRCARARQRLAAYERANLLYRQGKDGTREYLHDREREQVLAGLKNGIREFCD